MTFAPRAQAFLIALLILGATSAAKAQVLWYNGDYDFQSGLIDTDSTATIGEAGIVYDDFNVTSPTGWDITSVFGNFLYTTTATASPYNVDAVTPTANWEIRTGVSASNGGTLIASGTAPVTTVQTGTDRNYAIESVTLSGLNQTLAPGTYWIGFQPIATASFGYLVTTQGANAIGSPAGDDGNAFYTNSNLGYFFLSTSTIPPHDNNDFSLGLDGIVVVPEPTTWKLFLVGILIVTALRFAARPHRR